MITALNFESREITISRPALAGSKPIVIELTPDAVLRRYAPNSVKFSDAQNCRFEDLKTGDQIKALGDFNEDQSRYSAKELVSGAFRNIAGTVLSLDAGQGTIMISDLATGKRVEAKVISDSTVRRLSADVAQMIVARIQPGALPAGQPGAADRSATEGDATRQQSAGDLQSALERLPHIHLADLKPGDALILSCTSSADPSHVTAITLLAGVEPILRASSKGGRTVDLGSWNLDLNMSAGVP
ncbi:MAG TPA: hypothetical protein VE398_20075 [Acidobacteriota bacterium]|nr:hypothetical protein [Acidobacteriota bacterium]